MLLNQTRSKGNFLGLTLFCKMKPDGIIIKKTKGMKQVYFINNGKDNFLKDFGVIIN